MTTVLISGVTGTLGQQLLQHAPPDWVIRGLSRDEHKQAALREQHPDTRFLLGDVRDVNRLALAAKGCDLVIHAAALKHVHSGEHDPVEVVKTNVDGTLNMIRACLDTGVTKAVFVSSDKAVHPANLYGASKMVGERCWLNANSYAGTKFSAVRYGNVRGSRGSVETLVRPTLRDAQATRFWMTPEQAVQIILVCVREMQGGEVFIPKLKGEQVKGMYDFTDTPPTGLLPGEKLHEQLIGNEEVARTLDYGDHYRVIVAPPDNWYEVINEPARVPSDFRYVSGP